MKSFCLALVALSLMSCGSTEIVLHPKGTEADLILHGDSTMTTELIALGDSALVCLSDWYFEVPTAKIKSIRLHLDESRDWVTPVLAFQAVPSVLLLIGRDNRSIGAVGLGITALTWLAFELSEPRVQFTRPWDTGDLESLRLHMRFPQGLSGEQLGVLKGTIPGTVP